MVKLAAVPRKSILYSNQNDRLSVKTCDCPDLWNTKKNTVNCHLGSLDTDMHEKTHTDRQGQENLVEWNTDRQTDKHKVPTEIQTKQTVHLIVSYFLVEIEMVELF